jgi:hypothetical protein
VCSEGPSCGSPLKRRGLGLITRVSLLSAEAKPSAGALLPMVVAGICFEEGWATLDVLWVQPAFRAFRETLPMAPGFQLGSHPNHHHHPHEPPQPHGSLSKWDSPNMRVRAYT